MARRTYTRASLIEALGRHYAAGRIRGWTANLDGTFVVVTNDGHEYPLRSLREVHILVAGLASAAQAGSEKS